MKPSYDCVQRESILVRCIRCLKWWHQTKVARLVCGECVALEIACGTSTDRISAQSAEGVRS